MRKVRGEAGGSRRGVYVLITRRGQGLQEGLSDEGLNLCR